MMHQHSQHLKLILDLWSSPRWIFGTLYSRRSAVLNTTAGSSCPLLFSFQHTPNFFSAPPPLLSCLTCSSFCPVAEELIREWRGWGGGRRGQWMWWCWGPVVRLCFKMTGGGFLVLPFLVQMYGQHLKNMLSLSWGLPGATSVSKHTCNSLFIYLFPSFNPSLSLFYVGVQSSPFNYPSYTLTTKLHLRENTSLLAVMYNAKMAVQSSPWRLLHSLSRVSTGSLVSVMCMRVTAWGLHGWPSTHKTSCSVCSRG